MSEREREREREREFLKKVYDVVSIEQVTAKIRGNVYAQVRRIAERHIRQRAGG